MIIPSIFPPAPITIGETYGSQNLALVSSDEQDELCWKNYPVKINKSTLTTMERDLVFSILDGTSLSPSRMGGIGDRIICEIFNTLDEEYEAAIADYKNRILDASAKDKATIKSSQGVKKIRKELLFGIDNIARNIIPIISGAPFGIGMVMNLTIRVTLKCAEIHLEELDQIEASQFRIAAFHQISCLEEQRRQRIFSALQDSFVPLMTDLQELESENEYDLLKLEKLKQINRAYSLIFPDNAPLKLGETEVKDYIQDMELKIQYNESLHPIAEGVTSNALVEAVR